MDRERYDQAHQGGRASHQQTREDRISEAIEDHPIALSAERNLTDEERKEKKCLDIMFYVITSILLGVLVLLAIFVANFDSWISWVAGVAANSIAFILPALFYMAIAPEKKQLWYRLAIASMIVGSVS